MPKLISFIWLINRSSSTLASHSSPFFSSLTTSPSIGTPIAERSRDRGSDTTTPLDDSSNHLKSYRQISSIPAKIFSRDASFLDIPNIHVPISEWRGKSKVIDE